MMVDIIFFSKRIQSTHADVLVELAQRSDVKLPFHLILAHATWQMNFALASELSSAGDKARWLFDREAEGKKIKPVVLLSRKIGWGQADDKFELSITNDGALRLLIESDEYLFDGASAGEVLRGLELLKRYLAEWRALNPDAPSGEGGGIASKLAR